MTYSKNDIERVNFDLLPEYAKAVEESINFCDTNYLKMLKEYDSFSIGFFESVGRKRKAVRENLSALMAQGMPMYFGTLTFNDEKDKNAIETKRKESFEFLNGIFEYVLLVEEFGEENERYHIHFVGVFRRDKGFDDFRLWHSRQNLERVQDGRAVAGYLVKYASKQLPRVRRNKNLVLLHKKYMKYIRCSKKWFYSASESKALKDYINAKEYTIYDVLGI